MPPMRAVLAIALLVGCQEAVDEVVQPDDLAGVAEAYCEAHPELPCGHVYQCDDGVELCVLGPWRDVPEVEAVHGACEPTERHVGLCWWCCGEGCSKGCNAMSGCWCPQ